MGNLQQLGRAVMLPMIVLPAAAICMSLAQLPWDAAGLPAMAEYLQIAGRSLFLFLPYLFAAGVAWGTSSNGERRACPRWPACSSTRASCSRAATTSSRRC